MIDDKTLTWFGAAVAVVGGWFTTAFLGGRKWERVLANQEQMARDIAEIKTVTGPLPAIQATLTHQHEWIEKHDRDIHEINKRLNHA